MPSDDDTPDPAGDRPTPPLDYRRPGPRQMPSIVQNAGVAAGATIASMLVNPLFWALLDRVSIGGRWLNRLDPVLLATLIMGAHAAAFVALFKLRTPERDEHVFEIDQLPIFIAAIVIILSSVTSALAWFLIGAWRGFNPG